MSARITLVTGAPCSGKSTYVAENRDAGDLVVDLDALAGALGAEDPHDRPWHLSAMALEARDGVLGRLADDPPEGLGAAWVIATYPTCGISSSTTGSKRSRPTTPRPRHHGGRP